MASTSSPTVVSSPTIIDRDHKTRPPPDLEDGPRNAYGYGYAQEGAGPSTSYYTPISSAMAAASFSSPEAAVLQSLSRPPPQGLTFPPFDPMFLVASGKNLDKGFPQTPPPSRSHPHPFITHDVNELDWLGFLSETRTAGSLTEKDISRSNVPLISVVPFIGWASSYGIQQFIKSRKGQNVIKVIEKWNHHFFELRRMRVLLLKGHTKLNTSSEAAGATLHNPTPSRVFASIPEGDTMFRLFIISIE
ncbi:hypothetical protein NLJ89_g9799 [Agrocybe chaxingu]|uniref:Uncharacterized protein n=1 Tax=Agrocybe chaxingu TaxID=84603 RepID=A0A9W8JZW0_9AGAR|nr:hypothetical protein NLJ89_g9799 [Agrocybe chaxingu]